MGALMVMAYASAAHAQMGIVNQMLGHAIEMQRQQQYLEQQRRATDRAEHERAKAADRARKDEQSRQAAEKKAQEQRQAAEVAERRRAEAIQRVLPPAQQLVGEVSDFLKANPANPNMLKYVEALGGLTRAIKGNEPTLLEKQTLAVSQLMQKDPAFQSFADQRAAQRREENARYLAEVLVLGDRQKRFLLARIAQDPTGPDTEVFLGFVKSLEQQAAQPNPEELKTLTGQVDVAIRQAGLRTTFVDFGGSPAAAPSNSAAPPVSLAAGGGTLSSVLTERNRFLLEGSVDDVVFIYNGSSSAPHVLRNLKGDIVFEKRTAAICVFQRVVSAEDVSLARRTIGPLGLDVIDMEGQPCAAERLLAYDVIMVRRSALFREDQAYVFALLKQVEAGFYAQLVILPASGLALQSSESARRAEEIERQSRPGYGLILISNPSATICLAVEGERDAHGLLIAQRKQEIAAEIGALPKLMPTSLDTAFASLKRAQCTAVYADAASLKDLASALRRDGATFQFSALWFEPALLEQAVRQVAADKAKAEKQADEQRRAEEDRASIAALRQADEAKTREARQLALRSTNGRRAEAAATVIVNDVKLAIDGKAPGIMAQFPTFFSWLSERRADKWEVFSLNSDLFDFGNVIWKGRSIEAGLVRMDLKLRNTVLGEYKSYCFVFIRLADHEFQTVREPSVQACGDSTGYERWKRNMQFASLWTVE